MIVEHTCATRRGDRGSSVHMTCPGCYHSCEGDILAAIFLVRTIVENGSVLGAYLKARAVWRAQCGGRHAAAWERGGTISNGA